MTGQTVSHYRILEKLGEGGMGVVYKAEDLKLRRTVALKFLPQASDKRERLIREAQAAASLNHPNICTIYEIDEQRGFIAMEFVDGQTLEDRIKARPLPLNEVLDIAIQAAEGLLVAHQAGVVHRDMKPANLMITASGQVKIMDFGLAQLESRTRITRAGSTPGTPAYMSPEQVLGEKLDSRTDIWSLVVMLYEAVTGQTPFRGETEPSITYSIVHHEPELPTARRSGVPIELDRVIRKALAKDRNDRYQRMDDLLVDLRGLRAGQSGSSTVVHPRSAPSRRVLSAIGVALVLMGAAVIGWRRLTTPTTDGKLKSLAVLPLKSLSRNVGDSSLELGMADTIITRVSQLGLINVRPTSAVRKYAESDIDTLQAAKDLSADAVLEGTLQRDGDRLRVSVNLLRVSDGASLWAQKFDVQFAGIFDVQDQVSSQVAMKLQGQLDAGQRAKLTKRTTSNPEAYALYTKGVYLLGAHRSADVRPVFDGIDLLQKAITVDPGFALAHAQIASGLSMAAAFGEHNPALIARAKQELAIAEKLDPLLAEVHVVRATILRSQYENFQMEDAIRELLLAQKLDPNAGLHQLAYMYAHVGLEDKWPPLIERALELDPGNQLYKDTYAAYYYIAEKPDEGLAIEKRLLHRGPGLNYYRSKRMVKELRTLVDAGARKGDSVHFGAPALLLAFEGKHRAAQAAIPEVLKSARRDLSYHHVTYDLARTWALDGKATEAVKLLRDTADMGFPCYPVFQRDTMLDPIRRAPEFVAFLNEQKLRWEAVKREFQ